MNKVEASALIGIIESQSCLHPTTRQVGNGEWVVIVNNTWLWNFDDWDRCKSMWKKSLYCLSY